MSSFAIVRPDPKMTRLLDSAIDSALDEKRLVGTVVLVAREGRVVYSRAAGMADRESGQPMSTDTIFRLSSVTKPIVAIAAMRLVEQGRINPADPVARWLPYFYPPLADGSAPVITIHHLLTHTAGLGDGFNGDANKRKPDGADIAGRHPSIALEEELRRLATEPLLYEPGKGWRYSISMDVLGGIIEKETSAPLGEAVAALVTKPLGLSDTAFHVTDRGRLAVPYKNAAPQPEPMGWEDSIITPSGVFGYSPGRIFDPDIYHSASGGMAGTAGDILAILETIRRGGAPLLDASTVSAMIRDQTNGLTGLQRPGLGFGYGWAVVTDPDRAGLPLARGAIQWGGVYGHSWFIDPERSLTVVALTNTALEGLFGAFPFDIGTAIYQAR
ncbi:MULTISPECIES: serine hydrolase domain-containing protein [Rhizobium]|uniref:Esterase n=1 Tax=Rhizobium favelukesii TaxID=348824 RepID=W6RBW2_9HYPH|nr:MULTISPECIES: serine hydrolase domain-containing protein [Rhizobium]MCA0800396.1 beta-lactamase family protein [Rhizobium sp. T1473]MCS0458503.1 beta-lactamase family protein [Rhizobium favelukesii]UFS82138.1 beta-lactamase family protein [Rhizobium sp. T136]CDM56188.1 putative esterase [Rhizobium favelukesii]